MTADFPDTLQIKHDIGRHERKPHVFVRNVTPIQLVELLLLNYTFLTQHTGVVVKVPVVKALQLLPTSVPLKFRKFGQRIS